MSKPSGSMARARLSPLAASIATLFALATPFAAPLAHADVQVLNCNDTGAGSLRAAIATAVDGDTVDASQLECSTISLHIGAIAIAQDNLRLVGPGRAALVVDGNDQSPVITHAGSGTLDIEGLSLTHGYATAPNATLNNTVGGGCLLSFGTLTLDDVAVSHCEAHSSNKYAAMGGAIFAAGDLSLHDSIVSDSVADASEGNAPASGGGIAVAGDLTMVASEIRDNTASGIGIGGGVFVGSSANIADSTIAGNLAHQGGGIAVTGFGSGDPTQFNLVNSTVSGNRASGVVGGVALSLSSSSSVRIEHSTIAFNTATATIIAQQSTAPLAPGLVFFSQDASMPATLEGTLIANNTYDAPTPGDPAIEYDFSSYQATLDGSHNLVVASNSALPVDTIIGTCARLGPLLDNGGPTRTHALLPGSVAIDAGASDDGGLDHDQRGAPFPRMSGAATDIGAFEVWQGDSIFANGFDIAVDPCT